MVFCAKEKFWQSLCQTLEIPDLAHDPRCKSFDARLQNRDFVVSTLKPIFLRKTTREWLALLRGGVPSAPVNTLGEALNDPQVVRDMIVEADHPVFGNVKQVDSPIRIGERRRPVAAPAYGQHTDEILISSLGYTPEQIRTLRENKII